MKILLLNLIPTPHKEFYSGFHQGLAILGAYIKKANNRYQYISIHKDNINSLNETLKSFEPDLILTYTCSLQVELLKEISLIIKNFNKNILLIAGGPHATVAPENTIAIQGVDAICIGEGELALENILDYMAKKKELSGIKSLWIKKDNFIEKNPLNPLIENLDTVPFPERDIMNFEEIKNTPWFSIMGMEVLTSRGCPFQCTYCINASLQKIYPKNAPYYRRRSVQNVIEELEFLKKHFSFVSLFGFHDDTFILQKSWLKKFLDIYKSKINLPFWCNARVDEIDSQTIKNLKKAGCIRIHMGVESGNYLIRKNILNRNITDEQIIQAFKLAKDHGIKTVAFNMLGVPEDTEETVLETISLNKKIKPTWSITSCFMPLPGTKYFSEKTAVENMQNTYYTPSEQNNLSHVSSEKLEYYVKNFHRLI